MASATVHPDWGVEILSPDTVWFRIWATGHQQITLRVNGHDSEMNPAADGWFELQVSGIAPGAEYLFVLADGTALPDPASRAQKAGVDGPSLVTDPHRYQWQNRQWRGRPWHETVTYELHIGTFTPQGTFQAACAKLPYLAELGITTLEVMPLAHFGGDRGWGYDGVLLYAPHAAYGTPDDFKAFVDTAHGLGLSVVLDIVLNHFGPQGNFLPLLSPDFFHPERSTPWGPGIAYDVPAVRRYIADAPLYWLQEYQLDGLRFDAIDQIKDDSTPHLLTEIATRLRREITDRPLHLTTEDCRNIIALHPHDTRGLTPLFSGEWNDDFHNAVHVLATDETHGYYDDFARDTEQLVARALAEGFAYQGEISPQSGEPRGVDSRSQPPQAFVNFIQNHDQVGNRAQGERLISLAGAERTRVLLTVLLLSPPVPLLFMGEEYGETQPFLFFTGFSGELADAVRQGRAREFSSDRGYSGEAVPDPNAVETFTRSRLDWRKTASAEGQDWLALTRQLLALRRQHITPLLAGAAGHSGRVVATAAGMVAVSWSLPNGTLSVAFNIGKKKQSLPDLPGDTLFAWQGNAPQSSAEGSAQDADLPVNSVIVRLAQRKRL